VGDELAPDLTRPSKTKTAFTGPAGTEGDLCTYQVERSADGSKLKLLCGVCPLKDLPTTNCFANLVRTFQHEFKPDTVALSDSLETQYFGHSVTILRRVCEIADEIDRLSSRRPQEAPGIPLRQKGMCLGCEHNPSRLFPTLNTVLLEDVSQFHAQFKGGVSRLAAFHPPNETCLRCVSQTVSDFEFLFLLFEKFVREVLRDGFTVQIEGDKSSGAASP
jgi:hypothetical protein